MGLATVFGSLIPKASEGSGLVVRKDILCAGPFPMFFIIKLTIEGRVRSGSGYTMISGSVDDLKSASVTMAELAAISAMNIDIQSPVSI
jgi:hypothetical protein